MNNVSIEWDCGKAEIQTLGAMLGPVHFDLGNGKVIQPFVIAPWSEDATTEHAALPGILQRLRGEWPCVPFGAPSVTPELPERWQGYELNPIDEELHGFSSNHHWVIDKHSSDSVTLSIEYPEGHPIRSLKRTLSGVSGHAELSCTLVIEARLDVRTTLALHPVLALSKAIGKTEIELSQYEFGFTYPIDVEANVSRLLPDMEFKALDSVPTKEGLQSLATLPLSFDTEELVQLCKVRGPVGLINRESGYKVNLNYDQDLFPGLLLWISNRGRTEYPWLGRFTGVGIEPVCGAFDLGPDIGHWEGNPIAARGVNTSISIQGGESLTTSYSFSVGEI